MMTLSPIEQLLDRTFTHQDHTSGDLEILLHMLERVCAFIEFNHTHEHLQHPVLLPEPDGRPHRYVIPSPSDLAQARDLAVVGFFGQKRPNASSDHFGGLGEILMQEIPFYRDILGYSNMGLDDENFSNLVLLRDEAVKNFWMQGEAHTEAVSRSPSYYLNVRIYNGTLAGGITNPQTMHLTKVKYYDFQTEPHWRAERSLV